MSKFLPNGRAHAPFFIFMKLSKHYSDRALLAELGIKNFRQIEETPKLDPHAAFATCGDWTVIADDWYYSLWHLPTTRPAIERLSQHGQIYACSCGDCDRSFDFVYYVNGKIVRKYVVVDPDYNNPTVKEDFGERLPGEQEAFMLNDEMDRVLCISDALGIPRLRPTDNIRLYGHSTSWAVDFRARNSG